jgi:hypothetical protein
MRRLLYLSADPAVPVHGLEGTAVDVPEFTRSLVAVGVEVHLASPRVEIQGDSLHRGAHAHAIAAVRAGDHADAATLRGAVAAQAREVAELAFKLGVSAIYERMSPFGVAGVRAAAELGVPHALEVNTWPCQEAVGGLSGTPHPGLAAELEAETLADTGWIMPVSAPLAETLTERGVDPNNVFVQPRHRSWSTSAHAVVLALGLRHLKMAA